MSRLTDWLRRVTGRVAPKAVTPIPAAKPPAPTRVQAWLDLVCPDTSARAGRRARGLPSSGQPRIRGRRFYPLISGGRLRAPKGYALVMGVDAKGQPVATGAIVSLRKETLRQRAVA